MPKNWIWLPKKIYPDNQLTKFDALSDDATDTYAVAEFERKYLFDKRVKLVTVKFSADTAAQLFCNSKSIATGPSAVGGDFLGNGKPREWYYADEVSFDADGNALEFFARVKMCPTLICEYSKGRGGFALSATIEFEDGSTEIISTDESWRVRKNGAYVSDCVYDGRLTPDAYVQAEVISDVWNAELSPIPTRDEKEIFIDEITLSAREEFSREYELDKIYAGFLHASSIECETVSVSAVLRELANEESCENEAVTLCGIDEYRGFRLHSAGNITVRVKNESDSPTTVKLGFITTCYPVRQDAQTVTSDPKINEILSVCKHTLKYCRQTHHLDSPKHCEPLACTGDYYVESLMTAFSFGDMRLSEFDVERTAQLLRHNDGRIFHTTYSLIWVRMLYDVYNYGGSVELLRKCKDALDALLRRFETYVANNGLIENPPDYMFVDWVYIDEITLHHPPKALGQTVLNCFYYVALDYAERIYGVLGDTARSENCRRKKTALREAVNALLYDEEKGIYFEGLNTPTAHEQVNEWQPQNTEKRYYLKHSNIMAIYSGICDGDAALEIMDKIMADEIDGNVQPYFLHYLLEAIYKLGLRERYTLPVISRWKNAVEKCNKGLVEGFYPPEPTYSFDHSHAWGGTPLYSLPQAITGLTVVSAGYKRIKLNPSLLGLKFARVEIPTPYGAVVCELTEGEATKIYVPSEIELETEN